jgi:CelD/BcsL family acetyltransferase involved in cellulose biosynthesis
MSGPENTGGYQLCPNGVQSLADPVVDIDIELLRGEEAHRVLDDSEFVRRWNELFQRCTWSMAYQSVDYAMAWYRCYGELYEPLLIRGLSADGSLAGLLALGVSIRDGKLVFVGAPHAEYAAWLSGPQLPERFVEAALDALSTQYPAAGLTLRYLAPGAPVEWARSGRWASRCIVLDVDRPEMELKLESVRKSLSKRNNRNRLSRLRRYGQLEFCRLTDVVALASVLDAIFLQHDLRRIALYGMQPFRSDAKTQDFYLELMRSGRLHATVSTIGKHIVAAMIGICDQEAVHLELLCHSPRFSAESPGKLHLLTLAEHLVTEGFKYIDMTPGDLLWKERSATNYNSVHEIIVAFSRRGLIKAQTQVLATCRTRRVIKPLLKLLRLKPRMVKDTVRQLKDEGLRGFVGTAIRTIFGSLRGTDELKVYHFECVNDFANDNNLEVKIDALEDLFLLEENSVGLKRAFLRRAYERLCAGEHIFTHTEGGRLMGLCWAKATRNRCEKNDAVSPLCFLLHDPYYHSLADRKQLCLAFAKSIARACRSQFPDRPLKLCARHSDRDLTAALDELRREECPDTKIAAQRMLTASVTS